MKARKLATRPKVNWREILGSYRQSRRRQAVQVDPIASAGARACVCPNLYSSDTTASISKRGTSELTRTPRFDFLPKA